MAYNKAREEKKWRLWKEAEEKQLRIHWIYIPNKLDVYTHLYDVSISTVLSCHLSLGFLSL